MEIRIIIPKELKSTLRAVSAESPTPLKDTMLLSVLITRHGGSSTKKYLIILPIAFAFIVSRAPSISMNLPSKKRLIAPAAYHAANRRTAIPSILNTFFTPKARFISLNEDKHCVLSFFFNKPMRKYKRVMTIALKYTMKYNLT